jgi:hypothetical protein
VAKPVECLATVEKAGAAMSQVREALDARCHDEFEFHICGAQRANESFRRLPTSPTTPTPMPERSLAISTTCSRSPRAVGEQSATAIDMFATMLKALEPVSQK